MLQIRLRYYAELNDYLPPDQRHATKSRSIEVHQTIGEIIQDCGVPFNEIDVILVNGKSVDFSCEVSDGDKASIYPVFESFDVSTLSRIRSKPLRKSRFVLDVHLGKLAYYLRMLGFDALYRNDFRDEELIRLSLAESRILLSKDRKLLADPQLTRAYNVRDAHPPQQLIEVLRRFDLFDSVLPFQRCIRCNALLEPTPRESVLSSLPPSVALAFDEFHRCPLCGRVFWKGSHFIRMESFVKNILNSEREVSLT
jgi:uncharacterized protein with PIN domain